MTEADPRSDATLVALCNRGDAAAFEALYVRYRDWVARLALRFTGHHEDALDVLQETFAYLLGKFPGFALTARLTTFLYPAVKNLSIAARRKRARASGGAEALGDVVAPDPPAGADAGAARAELAAALAGLPEGQREALLMRFVDEMTTDEIAAALDVPVGTVKSRIHNALVTLRGDARARDFF